MPNVLQNLLGEGTLSASFIPVYSELLGQGRTKEAGRVAGAMFALLLGVAGVISLLGIAAGAGARQQCSRQDSKAQRRELMIAVVRIIFPMTGVLVLSAWALGILNSHRKFFMPYFAPVLWNAAIIAALVAFAGRVDLDALLMAAAWGALVGGFLQFGIQLALGAAAGSRDPHQHGPRRARFQGSRAQRRARDHGARRRAAQHLCGYGAREPAGDRRTRANPLRADAVCAAGQLVRHEHRGRGAAGASRERGSATEALRERAVAAARRVAFFVVPSLVAFVRAGRCASSRGIYRAGKFGAADVTRRVAHARRVQPGTARFDEHAHLSVRVLRLAGHEDARARRRGCAC